MDVHPPSSWLVLHQRSFNHHQAALFHFSLSFNIYCRNLKCQIFSPPVYIGDIDDKYEVWGMHYLPNEGVAFAFQCFFAFERFLHLSGNRAEGILWSQPCLWQNLNPSSGSFIRRSWCGWPPHRLIDRRRDFKPCIFHLQPGWSDKNHLQKLSFYSTLINLGENPGHVIAGKEWEWCFDKTITRGLSFLGFLVWEKPSLEGSRSYFLFFGRSYILLMPTSVRSWSSSILQLFLMSNHFTILCFSNVFPQIVQYCAFTVGSSITVI